MDLRSLTILACLPTISAHVACILVLQSVQVHLKMVWVFLTGSHVRSQSRHEQVLMLTYLSLLDWYCNLAVESNMLKIHLKHFELKYQAVMQWLYSY
jgi:hypothetical protein